MITVLVGFLTIAAFIAITMLADKYIGSHLPGVKHYKTEISYSKWVEMMEEECIKNYKAETFNNKECTFYPTMNTSSATICGACGKEKFEHNL